MTTFAFPLSQINSARLDSLVENSVVEGQQFEYKEVLQAGRDSEKTEFLRDVTSFANATGGDLLFGVKERRDSEGRQTGEPEEIVGLPGINYDETKNKLENLLRDGLDPRLSSVEFHPIPRPTGHPCLLLRVPRSWSGPHMVVFNKDFGFYSRNSAQRVRLDTAGIRQAVLTVETANTRVRAFRSERIARILAQETPVRLGEGGFLAFHAVPLVQNHDTWQRLLIMKDIDRAYALGPGTATSLSWRFNLDGWFVHAATQDSSRAAYVQAFRDGGVEAVYCIEPDQRYGGFHGINYERETIGLLSRCKNIWAQVGVGPPIMMALTLAGVQGKMLLASPDPTRGPDGVFDRDVAMIPEIVVFDLAAESDVILKRLLDYMWNGAGWAASPHYGDDGRWRDTK